MRRPLLLAAAHAALAGCAETVPDVECAFELPTAGSRLSATGGFNLQGTVTGTFTPEDLVGVYFDSAVEAAAGTYADGILLDSGLATTAEGCPGGCLAGGRFEGAVSPGEHTLRMAAKTPRGTVACEASVDVVVNQAPAVTAVTFDPASPTAADDITFVATTADPNGDEVSVTATWSREGAEPIQGETLAALHTSAGEQWTLRLRPRDDLDVGADFTATVTIGNTAPGTPEIVVTPAIVGDHQDIHCAVTNLVGLDADEQTLTVTYAWSVDGADAGWAMDTVPHSETLPGQEWACTATVSDGIAEVSSLSAGAVVRQSLSIPVQVPLDSEGVIRGQALDHGLGSSLAAGSPGDLDGDGFGDIAFTANNLVVTLGGDGPGHLYLAWGGASLPGAPSAATVDFSGPDGDHLLAPRHVGDLNGDGFDDMVVPFRNAVFPTASDGSGVYVVFGRAERWQGAVDLEDEAVRILSGGPLLGQVPCRLGDLDGDGYDDLGLTAPTNDGGTGALWVVYGHPGAWPSDQTPEHLQPGFRVVGAAAGQSLGTACAGGVDFDGNGFDDFAVGVPVGGPQGKGRVLMFLSDGSRRTGAVTSASASVILDGDATGAGGFGLGLAAFRDWDGDGAGDLAIQGLGAESSDSLAGALWVLSGGASLPSGPATAADLPTMVLGAQGTVDGDPAGLGFCAALDAVDLDGDGLDDLLCGDLRPHFGDDLGGEVAARIFFGRIGGWAGEFDWLDADLSLEALDPDSGLGAAVAGVPSFGGDGYGAALIGAPAEDEPVENAGAIYVLSL